MSRVSAVVPMRLRCVKRILRCYWLRRLLFFVCVLFILDRLFPPPLPEREPSQAQVVVAQDGTLLRAFPDEAHIWRYPVMLEEVSPLYIEALTGYEDRTFWWHPGVNPFALTRAAWQWVTQGRIVSGGSTITMQVARILEPGSRTIGSKLRQIVRAFQLELRYSKREILTLYLNYAPMGGVLEGVEAASRGYLGKPSLRLTHAEAALLAVLPQAPSLLRPDRAPERAQAARDKVLRRLRPLWGDETVAEALTEPVIAHTLREPLLAPLFAERMRRMYPKRTRIDTLLDPVMQSSVEQLLTGRLGSLPPKVSMAVLVVENQSLAVRVYAGSADFTDAERFSHIDMVRYARSPGSALKPFLYAFALDEGLIHSESLLSDVPQSFAGYQPGNFQQSFHGPVSVSEALVRSLNVPAVEVLEQLGPVRFVSLLRRGGLKLEFPRGAVPNLSVILGGAGTTLGDLTSAYTAFARQGMAGRLRFVPDAPLEDVYMMSPGAAFVVRDILESGGPVGRVIESGAGVRRGVAWKTGTSFGFRDAWAVGVSDRYTVGVWVGRPDGTPNPGFFGANIAAPLLVDIFDAIDGSPPAPRRSPPEVSQARVCWPLGVFAASVAPDLCHMQRTAWVLNGTAPPTFPDRLREGGMRYTWFRDPHTGRRVLPGCAPGTFEKVEAVRWPAGLEPWLSVELRRMALPPPWASECEGAVAPEAGLRIVGVSPNEVLRATVQRAAPVVKLEARGYQGEVMWLINGRLIARQPATSSLRYTFEKTGRYDITLMDDQGRYDRVTINVQ